MELSVPLLIQCLGSSVVRFYEWEFFPETLTSSTFFTLEKAQTATAHDWGQEIPPGRRPTLHFSKNRDDVHYTGKLLEARKSGMRGETKEPQPFLKDGSHCDRPDPSLPALTGLHGWQPRPSALVCPAESPASRPIHS
ncbi:hypothetical protein NDU88_003947 [Pleurodeles waltl]|uniref:Uncharacterized protein n=1 Tax=Pleurodeles waltl TaxID=8319 RepID=A0AAV7PIC0_PLEWA|nr:hypothetical protein NDU88_003947 [Pleurodeles waltl]